MGYVSKLYPKEFIVDESNRGRYAPPSDVMINGEHFARGLELPPPEERAKAYASLQAEGHARPFDRPIFSREVIRDIIKDREQNGTILSALLRNKKIPTSNQDSTNFCWFYGMVSAYNAKRAWRNYPYVEFSRESGTGPIKGYRNSGGWGVQALEYIIKYGIMPQELWPRYYYKNAQYNTPANLAIAANYKITEWWILQDRNFLQMMTALCMDEPVAVGYNWWSHEVCAVDPVIIGSTDLGIRIWNSWGNSYGDQGYAILAESKATPDDAVIPVVGMSHEETR